MNFTLQGRRIGGAHRLERLGVHPQLALVVVGAAAPDTPVLDNRLERFRAPLVARVHGHHVVVAVDQHRFGLGVDGLLGENHRIALRGQHVGTVRPGLHECRREKLGAALHVGFVLGLRAD
jgi:hypothetical protein